MRAIEAISISPIDPRRFDWRIFVRRGARASVGKQDRALPAINYSAWSDRILPRTDRI